MLLLPSTHRAPMERGHAGEPEGYKHLAAMRQRQNSTTIQDLHFLLCDRLLHFRLRGASARSESAFRRP